MKNSSQGKPSNAFANVRNNNWPQCTGALRRLPMKRFIVQQRSHGEHTDGLIDLTTTGNRKVNDTPRFLDAPSIERNFSRMAASAKSKRRRESRRS